MKAEILLPTEVEISHIKMSLSVRYEEEDMPNNYPFRKGDMWNIVVNVDTGKIEGWPEGIEPRELYMKVCDEGTYTLLTPTGTEIVERENDYVPHSMVPGQYGDYIDFKIDEKGVITNWPKNPSVEDFFEQD